MKYFLMVLILFLLSVGKTGQETNGGSNVHSLFVWVGDDILEILANTSFGKKFVQENQINLSEMKKDWENSKAVKIKVVENLIYDVQTKSLVDASVENGILKLTKQNWEDHFDKGRNIHHLVFKEMLRLFGYNDLAHNLISNRLIRLFSRLDYDFKPATSYLEISRNFINLGEIVKSNINDLFQLDPELKKRWKKWENNKDTAIRVVNRTLFDHNGKEVAIYVENDVLYLHGPTWTKWQQENEKTHYIVFRNILIFLGYSFEEVNEITKKTYLHPFPYYQNDLSKKVGEMITNILLCFIDPKLQELASTHDIDFHHLLFTWIGKSPEKVIISGTPIYDKRDGLRVNQEVEPGGRIVLHAPTWNRWLLNGSNLYFETFKLLLKTTQKDYQWTPQRTQALQSYIENIPNNQCFTGVDSRETLN